MFNVGPGELIVIALVLLIAVGPEQLPGLIRRAGVAMGQAKSMTDGLRSEFMSGLDEIERATDPNAWAASAGPSHVRPQTSKPVEPEDDVESDAPEPEPESSSVEDTAEDTVVEDTVVEDTVLEDTVVEDTVVGEPAAESNGVEDPATAERVIDDPVAGSDPAFNGETESVDPESEKTT